MSAVLCRLSRVYSSIVRLKKSHLTVTANDLGAWIDIMIKTCTSNFHFIYLFAHKSTITTSNKIEVKRSRTARLTRALSAAINTTNSINWSTWMPVARTARLSRALTAVLNTKNSINWCTWMQVARKTRLSGALTAALNTTNNSINWSTWMQVAN